MQAIPAGLKETFSFKSVTTILPNDISSPEPTKKLLEDALRNPVESEPFKQEKAERIAIIMADNTRYCSPFIPDLLRAAQKKTDDIKIVCAHGSHLCSPPSFFQEVLGEELYSCYKHDIVMSSTQNPSSRYELIGETTRGTPVELDKEVLDRDLVISSLNVQPHYFAGYEGGSKSLLPGCSSLRTIVANHSKVIGDPNAKELRIDGNCIREDINQSSNLMSRLGVRHRIVDFVMNRDKDVIGIGYGNPTSAHKFVAETYAKSVYAVKTRPARLIVTVADGPGARNLYQALKAVAFASNAAIKDPCKKSVVVLYATLQDGIGGEAFRHEMMRYGHEEGKKIIEDLKERARKGEINEASQKFNRLAIDESKMDLFIVSPEAPKEVESLLNETKYKFFRRWKEAFAALDASIRKDVVLIPHGSSTVPVL
jgi:nickel-dependent lactate racemase